jgi:hypothetical protein
MFFLEIKLSFSLFTWAIFILLEILKDVTLSFYKTTFVETDLKISNMVSITGYVVLGLVLPLGLGAVIYSIVVLVLLIKSRPTREQHHEDGINQTATKDGSTVTMTTNLVTSRNMPEADIGEQRIRIDNWLNI